MEYLRRSSKPINAGTDPARPSNRDYPQGHPNILLPPTAPIAQLSMPVPSRAWNINEVSKVAQPLDKALEDEKLALKGEFQKELEKLKESPESHPQYGQEWEKFWAKRAGELQASGKDPHSYDYVPEWEKFWDERGKELLVTEFTSKLEVLQLKYSRQSLTAVQKPVDSVSNRTVTPTATANNDPSPPNLASTLDGLRRLEDHLGPLMPQVVQFLRLAADMESSIPGSSNMLLNSRDLLQLLSSCKERFLTKMQTELISSDVLIVLNRSIYNLNKLLQLSSTPSQTPSLTSGVSALPSSSSSRGQKTDHIHGAILSPQESQFLNINEFNRIQPTLSLAVASNYPHESTHVEVETSVRHVSQITNPLDSDNSSWDFARRSSNSMPENKRPAPLKPPMAASSDQEWMDFFTRTEQNLTATRVKTDTSTTAFSVPTVKSSKSCLRVEPLERNRETESSSTSSTYGASKEKAEQQGPPIKKSCLRRSKPTPRSDSPELIQVVNPNRGAATTAESWRKVIMGSKTRPSQNEPRTAPRTALASNPKPKQIPKKPSPLVIPPSKPIVLTTSRNYDKTRRAHEFGSDSEDSDSPKSKILNKKRAENSVKLSSSESGTREENPGTSSNKESSVLSLLKARSWYQQYLDVEEGKSRKEETTASTSTSNPIPVMLSEIPLPSSSPPAAPGGYDDIGVDRPIGYRRFIKNKWRLVRDGKLELDPEVRTELEIKYGTVKRENREARTQKKKVKRLEEHRSGIIKPRIEGKLTPGQKKNKRKAKKRLIEKQLKEEIEPEPIIIIKPPIIGKLTKGQKKSRRKAKKRLKLEAERSASTTQNFGKGEDEVYPVLKSEEDNLGILNPVLKIEDSAVILPSSEFRFLSPIKMNTDQCKS